MKKRFTEEQIIGLLGETKAGLRVYAALLPDFSGHAFERGDATF